MKTIKSIVLAFAILVGTTMSATTNNENRPKPETVVQEIGALLEKPNFEVTQDIKSAFTFMINEEGNMVVLSVISKDKRVDRFVKSRLNYKKIENKLEEGKVYKMSINIQAK